MRIDDKTLVPDLAGTIDGTPGKGEVRLTTPTYASAEGYFPPPQLVSNVRFNEFQSATTEGESFLIDRKDSSNAWSFRCGIPDAAGNSVVIAGALTGQKIYKAPAITSINFEGSSAKMMGEYVQRAVSLGNEYLPARTFVQLEDATQLNLSTHMGAHGRDAMPNGITYMFRVMIDSSRNGASTENKAIFSIAGAAGSNTSQLTNYQLSVQGYQGGSGDPNPIAFKSTWTFKNGETSTQQTSAGKFKPDRWYTIFVTCWRDKTDGTTERDYKILLRSFDMETGTEGARNSTTKATDAYPDNEPLELSAPARAIFGYGELSGGCNPDYRLSDFITGVHIAEFAAWSGPMSRESMTEIARAHLRVNNYKSGIKSRPVKRVQQIFDSMDAYPEQSAFTGKRIDKSAKPYNSTFEKNFGLPELMIYPEMIPARLYSGSGGYFGGKRLPTDASSDKSLGYPSSYFPYLFGSGTQEGFVPTSKYMRGTLHEIPLKEGQYKDIRSTPYEWLMVATASQLKGTAHRETELLNRIQVAGYGRTASSPSLTGSLELALGGLISPFDDNAAPPDATAINEIATPEDVMPGLNQRLGDIVRIEIPIPTIEDAVMGVDASQGRIASMAYYNFSEQKWDRKFMPGISGSNIRAVSHLGGENGGEPDLTTSFWQDSRNFLLNSCSIGFGGTSGFSIFTDEGRRALMDLPTRGRPTSMYGFPHLDQYEGSDGQTLKISDYIDEPFLLQKIAIEFEGEVEESGPNSIATTIRTPRRWRAARQALLTNYGESEQLGPTYILSNKSFFVPGVQMGVPGVSMFYRSQNVPLNHTGSSAVNVPGNIAKSRIPIVDWKLYGPRVGLYKYDVEASQLVNPSVGTVGHPWISALTAQAHMNPYPTFVGGSSRPAIADMSFAYEDQLGAGAWQIQGWPDDKKGFPKSMGRAYAIQDTANAPTSISAVSNSPWRGGRNMGIPDGDADKGFPDNIASTTGYYSSNPSLMMYYNIPAGVFLPQIERSPKADSAGNEAVGRRDGVEVGGAVKLLFGGISGLVTGSYVPHPDASNNYYSSGSDPRGPTGEGSTPSRTSLWHKPFWECRNYVTFVDSFTITSGGVMTSTAGKFKHQDPNGAPLMYDSGSGVASSLPASVAPDTTGGAPFWRCDTFFLLHQKRGKTRFVGGEAEIVTAPEKQSFERLNGRTSASGIGVFADLNLQDEVSMNTQPNQRFGWRMMKSRRGDRGGSYTTDYPQIAWSLDASAQSQILEQAASDALGPWIGRQDGPGKRHGATTPSSLYDTMLPLPQRSKRIRLEETEEEFLLSQRTTHRELITYAQITHFGYAATEAVIPDAIIPTENYYVERDKTDGGAGAPRPLAGAGTGIDFNGRLLPVSRSFYSQAIKLGATNSSWTQAGYSSQLLALRNTRTGAGTRTRWTTPHRALDGSTGSLGNPTYPIQYVPYANQYDGMPGAATSPAPYAPFMPSYTYASASDQGKTAYMAQYGDLTKAPLASRGIIGDFCIFATDDVPAVVTGSIGNPMFLDPGAGSGIGNFWRYAEYDKYGDVNTPQDSPSSATDIMQTGYLSGKPYMRQFRFEQWYENPVYGGLRNTTCDTNANPSYPQYSTTATPGEKLIFDVGQGGTLPLPSKAPIAVVWDLGASGSYCGGKLNYMQIDWRYQCGTHYNSPMDSAPIALAPGPRWRSGETGAEQTNAKDWQKVGGRALQELSVADQIAGVVAAPTGSDFIGSMVSSASQPWHGTAITRSGFSIITSPTTPVPSGTHPDLSTYGSFHTPGLIWHRGRGIGGYVGIFCASALNAHAQDRYITSSRPVKVQNWLDAGLSRDLDVEVGWNFQHAAKEVGGGIAGFTILTASTVFPPGDLAGRFNGDHKLAATFKERRLLNAGNFRVVSDIKTQPAAAVDSAALFCFTAPAKRQYLVGTGSIPYGPLVTATADTSGRTFEDLSFGDNTRFSNDRLWWRAHAIEGGYIGGTTSKEWTTLLGEPPTLGSNRRYVASIAANKPVNKPATSGSRPRVLRRQVPQFAPGPGIFRAGFGPNRSMASSWAQPIRRAPLLAQPNFIRFDGRMVFSGSTGDNPFGYALTQRPIGETAAEWSNLYTPITSASLSTDKPKTSLYLLMPGDEIVLGFQPSLHGSNRGNNTIPANPNVNPYGPWRRGNERIFSGSVNVHHKGEGVWGNDGIYGRQEIPTGSAYNPEWNYTSGEARDEVIDSRGQGGYHLRRGPNKIVTKPSGQPVSANNANMETLYEPRSSFTIKKSAGAKLVLYGTLLRNKKHVPPQSNISKQRTAAVHEAIMGAPVTDQYQIATRGELSGSYTARLCTGSILLHQINKNAQALESGSSGFGSTGPDSPYNPNSDSFVQLGGPWWNPVTHPGDNKEARNSGDGIRGIFRPNMRYTKEWRGLGGINQPGWAAGSLTSTSKYWPIAPASALYSMGISGSVQRFVRLADDSEYYYDSMIPNPRRMFAQDLELSGTMSTHGPGSRALDDVQVIEFRNLHWSIFNISKSSMGVGTGPTMIGDDDKNMAFNQWWSPSFPFEERYKNVRRLALIEPALGTTGSAPLVIVQNTVSGTIDPEMLGKDDVPSALQAEGAALATTRVAIERGSWDESPYIASRIREYYTVQADPGTQSTWGFSPQGATRLAQIALFGFWKTKYGDGPPLPLLGLGLQYGWNPDTNVSALSYAISDHPSGWRYGLMNYKRTASSAVYRSDRYGQLRDMLEQRQYTKFWDAGDETNPSGIQEPAVSCIFVDGDGNPLSEPRLTTCFNVSAEMTSSVPYKEGVTARAFLFSSETVSITPLVQSFAASPFLSSV